MPKPYSLDLREKIVAAYENKEGSMQKLASRFNVSKNFVASLIKRFKQTGTYAPKPHGGGHPPEGQTKGETFLKELIANQPDLILFKLCDEYNEHFEPVSCSTINRTLIKFTFPRKKKTLFDPKKNTSSIQQKQQDYQTNIATGEAKD